MSQAGTKEDSIKVEKPKPAETQVALVEDDTKQKEFNDAVTDAVKHQFDVNPLGWGIRSVTRFVLELPDQKILMRHLDTMDLAKHDLIDELDFFAKRLFAPAYDNDGNHAVAEEDRKDIWATLKDPKKKIRFLELTNKLMSVAVEKPKVINDGVAIIKNEDGEDEFVFGHEVSEIDRQIEIFGKPIRPIVNPESETYAGAIDFGDRIAIFNAINMPLEMIEPFCEGPNAMLAGVESS